MTKEDAIFNLEAHINTKSRGFNGEHIDFRFPVKDELVCVVFKKTDIEHWTFWGLIKFIYDLEDKH